MSRRLIAALLALASALIAGMLVFAYVSGADRRAAADLSPTPVLVVTEPVPAGTPAEAMADYVTVKEVPETAVVPGGVTSLRDVAGQVTIAPLVAGEQLLVARFVAPELAEAPGFEIPAGFHQVTIQLEPRRVLGGHLAAGATVGFFASIEGETDLVLHKVLVTRVAGAAVEATEEQAAQGPAESLMVTLAVTAADAAKVVSAAEYYPIWLTLEPADAPDDNPPAVTSENLFP